MLNGAIGNMARKVDAAFDQRNSPSGLTKASVKAALAAADSALASRSERRMIAALMELRSNTYNRDALKRIAGNDTLERAVERCTRQLADVLVEVSNQKAAVESTQFNGRFNCRRPDLEKEGRDAGDRQRPIAAPGERHAVVQRGEQVKAKPVGDVLAPIASTMRPRAGEKVQAIKLLENARRHASTPEERQQVKVYEDAAQAKLSIEQAAMNAESTHDNVMGKLRKDLGTRSDAMSSQDIRQKYPEAQAAYDGMMMADKQVGLAIEKAKLAYRELEETWIAQGFEILPQAEETRLCDKVFGAR